jgi:hypothetical protein
LIYGLALKRVDALMLDRRETLMAELCRA